MPVFWSHTFGKMFVGLTAHQFAFFWKRFWVWVRILTLILTKIFGIKTPFKIKKRKKIFFITITISISSGASELRYHIVVARECLATVSLSLSFSVSETVTSHVALSCVSCFASLSVASLGLCVSLSRVPWCAHLLCCVSWCFVLSIVLPSVQPLFFLFLLLFFLVVFYLGFVLHSLCTVLCLAPIYIVACVVVGVLCCVWLRLTVLFLHTWLVVPAPVLMLSAALYSRVASTALLATAFLITWEGSFARKNSWQNQHFLKQPKYALLHRICGWIVINDYLELACTSCLPLTDNPQISFDQFEAVIVAYHKVAEPFGIVLTSWMKNGTGETHSILHFSTASELAQKYKNLLWKVHWWAKWHETPPTENHQSFTVNLINDEKYTKQVKELKDKDRHKEYKNNW